MTKNLCQEIIVTKELGNESLLAYGMTEKPRHENLAELVIAEAW